MAKRWTKEETTYLKRYAAKRKVRELAERFDADVDAVRKKLDEMGLAAADHPGASGEPDPGIASIEEGVEALYAKKYAQAEKHFEQAEADAGQSEVANMARRYLAAARQGQEEYGDAADPYLEAVYQRNQGNLDAALQDARDITGRDDAGAHIRPVTG